jgi:hypothetical protein
VLWAIRRNALNYYEVRPWVLDEIIRDWREQPARLIASSMTAALALLPAGAELARVQPDCLWWFGAGIERVISGS